MTCKLTSEIKEEMKKQKIFAVATASKSGIPNVVPVGFVLIHDDNTIWIIDNFFKKTLANMKENPVASLYVWNPECKDSYQIKGKISIENGTPDHIAAADMAHKIKETYPVKNLVKFTITDIFYVSSGPKAGERI
ncbi:MAG: pyridoxamine 5'-phosphate oxidase family protein [Candidatus Methanomethylophilaceae archaeon]|nr:pyridoxamine 5'-phosphate oxidase family protein [Candidatus Methanomethylophilaceae archaeon]MDY0224474.1 pyridoxamine 5'-phosphate oxidase family protein [Candidatus Methanomethylophilaceae archaeon]